MKDEEMREEFMNLMQKFAAKYCCRICIENEDLVAQRNSDDEDSEELWDTTCLLSCDDTIEPYEDYAEEDA